VAGPGSALTRIVAETYARVLAYKDEYEVARLYSLPAFRAGIAAEFTGDFRLSLYLAPPILSRKAPDDRPAKREFGRWILPVLGVLARLKGLRGTWADPFGYGEDRKLERKLIADYEADLDLAERCLETGPVPLITELLALPQEIRGFGPVKKTAYIKQMARREILRAQILDGNMAAVGAAA
jgi:indolepyruvate ferredoxin oxidoreductase